jgi:hypothetical protein
MQFWTKHGISGPCYQTGWPAYFKPGGLPISNMVACLFQTWWPAYFKHGGLPISNHGTKTFQT